MADGGRWVVDDDGKRGEEWERTMIHGQERRWEDERMGKGTRWKKAETEDY
jgi:hypothetical protein